MKKEENNITKDVLSFLLVTGGISLILTNPAFLAPAILIAKYADKDFNKRKGSYSVSYLKKKGMISISKNGRKTHVSLTKKGMKRAQLYQIELGLLTKKESFTKEVVQKWSTSHLLDSLESKEPGSTKARVCWFCFLPRL